MDAKRARARNESRLFAQATGVRWKTLVLGVGLCFWALLEAAAPLRAGDPPHVPLLQGMQGRTCYECHIRGDGIVLPSEERPSRYSIRSAWVTYLASPHGRLRTMGDLNSPLCEDCHMTREWSDILPQEHPDSPINAANLPATCARCHGDGMLTADVSAGSMHLEMATRTPLPGKPLDVRYGFLPGVTKREASYYIGPVDVVALFHYSFLVLTIGTLSAMALYMVLDLWRKLQERRQRQQAEEQV